MAGTYQDIALCEFFDAAAGSPVDAVAVSFVVEERRHLDPDYQTVNQAMCEVAMTDLLGLGLFGGMAIGVEGESVLYANATDALAHPELLQTGTFGGMAEACKDNPLLGVVPADPWNGLGQIISGFWIVLMRLLNLQRQS